MSTARRGMAADGVAAVCLGVSVQVSESFGGLRKYSVFRGSHDLIGGVCVCRLHAAQPPTRTT